MRNSPPWHLRNKWRTCKAKGALPNSGTEDFDIPSYGNACGRYTIFRDLQFHEPGGIWQRAVRARVARPTCAETIAMNTSASIAPVLAAHPASDGTLRVRLAGDWLERKALPSADAVRQELVKGGAKAMQFDAHELGRWDSALMVRILALNDPGAQAGVEFRVESLPEGLAKLVALSQAVPEKKDAARKEGTNSFLERVGESGLAAWTGGRAMLDFLGESVVSLFKLARGQAQCRW